MITVGSSVPIAFDVRDASGALTHAATATLTITLPDGTTATPVITDAAVAGQYRLAYLPPTEGFYQWDAETTGPSASYGDVFNVRAYLAMVGLAEMKAHLNMTGTANDDELRNFIMCATELVEVKGGYTIRRQFTDEVDGPDGIRGLAVPRQPVLSVQSVTSLQPAGPSWQAADLRADSAGIIWQLSGSPFWGSPWAVAYTVGRVAALERHLQAVKEQVRHLWDTQRGSMAPSLLSGEEVFTASTGFSFSVPRRVLELVEDEMVPSI